MQSTWHPGQAAQVAQGAPPELQLRLLRLGEHLVELRARAESHVDQLLSGQDEALQQISQIRSRLLDLISPQSVTKVERLSRLAQRLARLEQRVSKEQATCVHVLEAVLGTVERSALSMDEVFPLSSSKAAGPTAAVAHLNGTSLQSRSSVPPPVSRASSYQSSMPLPATSGCPPVHAPGLQSSTLGPHLPNLTPHAVSVPPPASTMFATTDPPASHSTATGSHVLLVAHDPSYEPLQPSFHGEVAEHQDAASQRQTQGPVLFPNASQSQTQLVVPSEPSPTPVALQRSSPAAEPCPNPPGFTGRPGGPAEAEPFLLEAARAPLQDEVLENWVSNHCQPSESIYRAAPEPAGVTEPTTGPNIIPARGLGMPPALATEAPPQPPEETDRVQSSATAVYEGGPLMQQEPHHEELGAPLEVRHPPEVPTVGEALHPDPQVAMAAATEVQVCQEAPTSPVVSAAPPLTAEQERSAPSSVKGAWEVPVHNEGALGPEASAAGSTSHAAAETPGGPQDAPMTSQLPESRDASALSRALQQVGFNSHLDGPHGVDLHIGDEDALGHMLQSLLVPRPEGQAGQEARPALGPHVATAGAAEEPRVPRVMQCPPSTTAPASSPIMSQWDAAGQTRHGQPPAATSSLEGRFHSTPGGPEVVRCFTSSEVL